MGFMTHEERYVTLRNVPLRLVCVCFVDGQMTADIRVTRRML